MSKRRKYSAEFKREAVQLASMPGATLRQVAQDLGLNEPGYHLIDHFAEGYLCLLGY